MITAFDGMVRDLIQQQSPLVQKDERFNQTICRDFGQRAVDQDAEPDRRPLCLCPGSAQTNARLVHRPFAPVANSQARLRFRSPIISAELRKGAYAFTEEVLSHFLRSGNLPRTSEIAGKRPDPQQQFGSSTKRQPVEERTLTDNAPKVVQCAPSSLVVADHFERRGVFTLFLYLGVASRADFADLIG